nr:MAG TPA: hypothetical protein [Caudoviricetes sp.]
MISIISLFDYTYTYKLLTLLTNAEKWLFYAVFAVNKILSNLLTLSL